MFSKQKMLRQHFGWAKIVLTTTWVVFWGAIFFMILGLIFQNPSNKMATADWESIPKWGMVWALMIVPSGVGLCLLIIMWDIKTYHKWQYFLTANIIAVTCLEMITFGLGVFLLSQGVFPLVVSLALGFSLTTYGSIGTATNFSFKHTKSHVWQLYVKTLTQVISTCQPKKKEEEQGK